MLPRIEVEAVGAEGARPDGDTVAPRRCRRSIRGSDTKTRFYSRGQWHEAADRHARGNRAGLQLAGPALLIEPHQTVVVEPGWRLEVSR